jgi:hypothetical protein
MSVNILQAMLPLCSLVISLAGCGSEPEMVKKKATTITVVPGGSTEGFWKSGTLGARSAWCNMKRHEVLIVDESDGSIITLTGLPRQFGMIDGAGWEKDAGNSLFFISFTPGADCGAYVYIDLKTKEVVKINEWRG